MKNVGLPSGARFFVWYISSVASRSKIEPLRPGDPAIMDHFKRAMEIWYRGLPEVPIQQWYHRIPMNQTYGRNWPTEADPYMPPAVNFESTPVYVAYKLQPAS